MPLMQISLLTVKMSVRKSVCKEDRAKKAGVSGKGLQRSLLAVKMGVGKSVCKEDRANKAGVSGKGLQKKSATSTASEAFFAGIFR